MQLKQIPTNYAALSDSALTERSRNGDSDSFAELYRRYLTPVYRAYNNGYALGIESNHRFSTDPSAIQEVVAQGWIDEGVRFCAPQ